MTEQQLQLYHELELNRIEELDEEQIESSIKIHEQKSLKGETDRPINQISSNILSILQSMIKLTNHPLLLVDENRDNDFQRQLKSLRQKKKIDGFEASGKFQAFKDLLKDLLGKQDDQSAFETTAISNNINKLLVFSKYKKTLSLLIELVIHKHFPYITYLKLDGDVASHLRPNIVSKFNEDPTIKILFLTKQIGSLGLNLASANVVVMIDHDYNPVSNLLFFY